MVFATILVQSEVFISLKVKKTNSWYFIKHLEFNFKLYFNNPARTRTNLSVSTWYITAKYFDKLADEKIGVNVRLNFKDGSIEESFKKSPNSVLSTIIYGDIVTSNPLCEKNDDFEAVIESIDTDDKNFVVTFDCKCKKGKQLAPEELKMAL